MATPSNQGSGDDDVTLDPDVTIDPVRPAESSGGGGRVRGVFAGVLGVLAILVLTVTAVAVWANATVFNSEKVADIVGDALGAAGGIDRPRRVPHHAGLQRRRRRCRAERGVA